MDQVHFTNVINNIIENAIKYSGDNVDVFITTRNTSNHKIEISISDNGLGFDKKQVKKIFEKFYRIIDDNTHNVKGFGLGLFYVKQIALAHRWDLEVDSEPKSGTSFKISIPQINTYG